MPTIGKGVVEVVYDKGQAEKAARDAILPGLGRVAGDIAGVFAGKKIFDFAKQGFEEVAQAEKVSAQTANTLKNLGSAAGVTADDIDTLSTKMLKQSGVDDELAQAAANTALRLGVQGDAMKRVVQDANDLSQSFGDINSDSELLAKALAKPESAAKLLKPAIGALTAEQQKSVAAFVAQGDAAAAQNVILDAVEAKVHGAAAAFGETLPGQIAIAKQSMANVKGELVAGLAPALTLGTKGVTFLTDEFEKLPESGQAAIGVVGLVGAGVTSLARPVGDVVRLYQTWRQRSEEVTAAQTALATAEAAEATASATGAASSASATAATAAGIAVTNDAALAAAKRVVSNEALVFSDAEIAAAEAARQTAEFQSLISNDALIVSDLELEAANQAAAASAAEYAAANGALNVGLVGTAGAFPLIIAGGGIAAGVYSAIVDALDKTVQGTAEYTAALEKNTGTLKQNVDEVTANKLSTNDAAVAASKAGVSYSSMFDAVRSGTDDWGEYGRQLAKAQNAESLHTNTTKTVGDALRAAGAESTAFGRELIAQADAGKLNAFQMSALVKELEGLHNGFTDATGKAGEHKTATDAVTQSTEAEIVAIVDASQAAEDHAKAMDDARAAVDALNSAEKGLVDSMVGSFQAAINKTEAQVAAHKAMDDLTKAQKDQTISADELTSKTDAALTSIINEAQANEALVEAQAKVNGYTIDGATAQKALIDELNGVLGTLDEKSPLRMALQGYIDELNSLPTDKTTTLHLVIADEGKGAAVTAGNFKAAATGGSMGPNEKFRGAERGFEILWHDGLYQAPPSGGFVMPHDQSQMFLSALSSGVADVPRTVTINDRITFAIDSEPVAEVLRRRDRALR